ncbi:uncharacterized protein L203_104375 [Cryptococcus depauperatus CBS 7841]|uniref:BZIP domain-containing protein n=1 Tax=Cryptococcus depauperatus CBS 7841 TaxID=1295531 RepID=A0AAJ8JVE8_9TREE
MAFAAAVSSSKRSAPSPESLPPKRPRHSSLASPSKGEDTSDDLQELDEVTRAKIARKEARTIRNRESAQRSRNARRLHLTWLEKRVVELEVENMALKNEQSASTQASTAASSSTNLISTSSSGSREASPLQEVAFFATNPDLSTPISAKNISLSDIAPPPPHLGISIQSFIDPLPATLSQSSSENPESEEVQKIKAENSALKQRITLLENLVKQVVSIADLSGQSEPQNALSMETFANRTALLFTPSTGLSSTLSPDLFPIDNTHLSALSQHSTTSYNSQSESLLSPDVSNPVASGEGFFNTISGDDTDKGSEAYDADSQVDCCSGQTQRLGCSPEAAIHETSVDNVYEDEKIQAEMENWDETLNKLIDFLEEQDVSKVAETEKNLDWEWDWPKLEDDIVA